MKLYNSLTKTVQEVSSDEVSIYSCGPTVYDNVHIGNLFAFIVADSLRRALLVSGKTVKHVMNTTDVDDKTIKRSKTDYPELEAKDALIQTTQHFEKVFIEDSKKVGIDIDSIKLVRATEHIEQMQQLISTLYDKKIAYIADDGIYFSIEAYRQKHKYGILTEITESSTGKARVANDEYDKDNIHDFALWKVASEGEPSWEFELDGSELNGRPGWHIECSAMSTAYLGQPFTVHTGGVDLKFPHHENEIAQSTGSNDKKFTEFFIHSEHVKVDDKKMSKSAGNFYTLRDIEEKGFNPLAFRLLVLQSHYRHQLNFSFKSLSAAQHFLNSLTAMADRKFQPSENSTLNTEIFDSSKQKIIESLANDVETPKAISVLAEVANTVESSSLSKDAINKLEEFLQFINLSLGVNLDNRQDISNEQKQIIINRENSRSAKDYDKSDVLRDELKKQGIEVRDTSSGTIWSRV